MYLARDNWEDAALKADDGIHNWPNSYYNTGWWEPGMTKKKKNIKII